MAAIAVFFAMSIVGAVVGLTPYTCCKRALLGAIVTYWAASAATWAIDAIVTQAMIASQIGKDKTGDDEDR
jgi:VIT1/CCC1 family predicted Fe2+/Mn2+ transporter